MLRTLVRRYSQYALRDYQRECISSCLEAFNQGKRRIGVSLATGGGKTVIFSHLVGEVAPLIDHRNGNKSLIVVHREELVNQAYDRIKQIQPNMSVEVEMAEKHATGMADVTVASIQSIARKHRITKFDPKDYKLLIIDEAHHAAANQYLRLLSHFGANVPQSKVAVAGFSATLYRQDGKSLSKAMDELVFHRDLVDMIQSKWLCNVHITTVKTELDLSSVEVEGSDFKNTSLSDVLNTPETNELIVRAWSHHSNNGQKYKSTMIFCAGIDHSVAVADSFRKYGIDARVVTSNTASEDRKRNVEEFKQGKYPVIVNCGVFTEGTDMPNIDMIILNRPTTSPGLLSQMIGRGLRTHPGKDHCHIIDIVGVAGETDIATTPALFRIQPSEPHQEMPTVDVIKELEQAEREARKELKSHEKKSDPSISQVKFETYDNLNDYLKTASNLRPAGYSSLNWLPINSTCYILTGYYGYVRLEELRNGKYSLSRYYQIPFLYPKRYRKEVIFDDVADPKEAVIAADRYIADNEKQFPNYLIQKSAKWKTAPATSTQVSSINKYLSKIKPELRAELDRRRLLPQVSAQKLKKGIASDLMSQFMYGGPTSVLKWMVSQDRKREQLKKVQQFGPPRLHVNNRV